MEIYNFDRHGNIIEGIYFVMLVKRKQYGR